MNHSEYKVFEKNFLKQVAEAMHRDRVLQKDLMEILEVQTPAAVTKILNGTTKFTLKNYLTLSKKFELNSLNTWEYEIFHLEKDELVSDFRHKAADEAELFEHFANQSKHRVLKDIKTGIYTTNGHRLYARIVRVIS